MCVADDAVDDRVGEGGLADGIVPFRQTQLDADQAGSVVVSVLNDFEEIAPLIGIEAFLPQSPRIRRLALASDRNRRG